jgi:hypothetical protein
MNKHLLVVLTVHLISCGQHKSNIVEEESSPIKKSERKIENVNETAVVNDTANWLNRFRDFRSALYRGDKLKVKTFIDFPIYNPNNEIWYLASGADDKSLELLSDKIKPFTEKEFDKNYDKIFPRTFINSILKIKTEILLNKGEYETDELIEEKTAYKIYATYDRKTNTLILNLASKTPITVNDGENDIIENSEFNVIYYFDIEMNNVLKFKQVRMAG